MISCLFTIFCFIYLGILRFYRGYAPALLQGPISRFGDTATNVGILALLEPHQDLPIAVKTGAASLTAGLWRIMIMPIDTVKTTLQVEGQGALGQLRTKVGQRGFTAMFHGSLGKFHSSEIRGLCLMK